MKKIIIRYAGVDELVALSRVYCVIESGRVSTAYKRDGTPIKHYCWHTVFRDGVTVSALHKRSNDAPDVFFVSEEVANA